MKKIFYLLLLSISFTNAQITLEHTYVNQGDRMTNYNSFDFDVIYTQTGMKYVTYNRVDISTTSSTTDVKIYDENHNLLKTITCPNLVKVYSITDKLFNNDDKMEILYQASRFYLYGSRPLYINDVILRDDDGAILASFEERIGAKIYKTFTGNYKLIVHTYDNPQQTSLYNGNYGHDLDFIYVTYFQNAFINSEATNPFHDADASTGAGYVTRPYSFDIYALTGTLSIEQEQQYLKNSMLGYPIPTGDSLNITNKFPLEQDSKLEVFDINGKKILEKNVVVGSKDLSIDVSGLTSGTYIYKLNGVSSKFIKE
jgi:hypothetical protein